MSDMSVSFARRHNRNYSYYQEKQNNNTGKKTVAAGVAAGGAYASRKIFKTPITADAVAITMHNMNMAEEGKKLQAVKGVANALSKEGASLTEDNVKTLGKAGIAIPEGANALEFLKGQQKTMTENLDANNAKTIKSKIDLLTDFIKKEKTVKTEPATKTSEKIVDAVKRNTQDAVDGLKKKIAKAFHMEVDEKGMPKTDFNAEELLENTKTQGRKLSEHLIDLKKSAKEKLEDIKLLDSDDVVTKAYKSIQKNRMAWGIGAAVTAGLALLYMFKGGKKD